MRARARAGFFIDFDRGRSDENGGLHADRRAGAEGLVVYQETYHRGVYAEMHTTGPKRDFYFRLGCAERAYAAGFRRLGIGALIGLSRWRDEAIALAAHLEYLLQRCWQAQITVSLPRLRPAAGGFRPLFSMTDRELAQFVCALRITFPQVGIVFSTRERAALRDSLVSIGVTMMSAGSHTEPGGYTGVAATSHRTVAVLSLRPSTRTAKTNSPPVSLRSVTNVRRRKSRLSFAAVALSRSGKIGTRRSEERRLPSRRGNMTAEKPSFLVSR